MQTNSKNLSSDLCVPAVRMLVMVSAAAMVMSVLMAVVVMMLLMVVHWLLLIGKRRENLVGEAGCSEPIVNINCGDARGAGSEDAVQSRFAAFADAIAV